MKLRGAERSFEVRLRQTAEGTGVEVDGQAVAVDVEPVAPGVFVVRRDGTSEDLHCVRDGRRWHLAWRGRVYVLEEEAEGSRPSGRRSHAAGVEAPMPGKVIAIEAEPGSRLAKGAPILVVEAMKMENVVRAPRDGTLGAFRVAVGDSVTPGQELAEFD